MHSAVFLKKKHKFAFYGTKKFLSMKKGICVISILLCAAWLPCSCNKTEDYVSAQQTAIEKYFSDRKIYNRAAAPENETGELLHFYDIQNGVYKYTENEYSASRPPQSQAAAKGDSIEFYFRAYTFTNRIGELFYTNVEEEILALGDHLDARYWATGPLRIKIGSGSVIKGLDDALPSCRVGDTVQVFIPTDRGFGNKSNGTVPANTALMYLINIQNITKNR